jgi:prepilin-type N-terminal cleavage/methylation domain-containing protein
MIQPKPNKGKGFTLIEVLIGMALIGAAILGLAELFTLAMLQNRQADRIANATFLAQQEIDAIRNMTLPEISALAGISIDEPIDTNGDGVNDYRRISQIVNTGSLWDVRVMVFSAEQIGTPINELIADPEGHKARAQIQTMISRG